MYDSSEWVDELQLLVSEGTSLEVHGGNAGLSGGDEGGGGKGGGGGGGGGRGRGRVEEGGAGRHGWKPLHLGFPLAKGAEGSNAFRVSTLSKDFVLQRFFYKENIRYGEII